MPILDFNKQLEASHRCFFADPKVSNQNKEYVTQYLAYLEAKDTKMPTRSIFLRHSQKFFRECPDDIKDLFNNNNQVNIIFSKLRSSKFNHKTNHTSGTISPATYQTIIGRIKAFVRWLNEGEIPKGFTDIKRTTKDGMRKITSADMLTEQEIQKLLSTNIDVQTKAMIAVLLDGGFRPSEFYDLQINDITKIPDFFRVKIKDGKTGQRTVYLHHATPYLTSWLNIHPNKNEPSSWLWLTDNQTPGRYRRPTTNAIKKKIKNAFSRANINKKCDIYILRHNANVRKKRDGVQDSIAAQQAGHSVKIFAETYGRLCDDDKESALRKAYGLSNLTIDNKPKTCSCGHLNISTAEYCEKCSLPLSISAKIKEQENQQRKIEQLVNSMVEQKLNQIMASRLKR